MTFLFFSVLQIWWNLLENFWKVAFISDPIMTNGWFALCKYWRLYGQQLWKKWKCFCLRCVSGLNNRKSLLSTWIVCFFNQETTSVKSIRPNTVHFCMFLAERIVWTFQSTPGFFRPGCLVDFSGKFVMISQRQPWNSRNGNCEFLTFSALSVGVPRQQRVGKNCFFFNVH